MVEEAEVFGVDVMFLVRIYIKFPNPKHYIKTPKPYAIGVGGIRWPTYHMEI